MLDYYQLLQLQCSVFQLLLLAEAKEYDAGWLDGGKKVYREGGRFASKGSSDDADAQAAEQVRNAIASLPPEQQKVIKKAMDGANQRIDKVVESLDKLPPDDQKKIKDFITSPNMKKAREQIAKLYDAADPEAGKKFREVNAKIDGELGKGGSLKKILKGVQNVANNVVQGAKENPELVVGAAISAACVVAGGAGAVALFSLPNLLGVGGVFGGLVAATGGETVGAITAAFASGGLSQMGFGISAYLAVSGVLYTAQDAVLLANKDLRDELQAVQKRYLEDIQSDYA
jgi:hypothetical protein